MKYEYVPQIRQYRLASCDITCNCNLRCRFCFNDFSQKNFNMTEDIFQDIFRVVPYLPEATGMDGKGFYFSCLWEPSIHPRFLELLQMIPEKYRSRVFFTSNFAKPYTDEMIEQLARANVNHINISIETLDGDKYKQLTGGTEKNYENFFSNLEKIAAIFPKYETAPKLRFISMALKSNYQELEAIVEKCQKDYHAFVNEIRTPFEGTYIERFQEELLDKEEIAYLERVLAKHDERVSYYLRESDVCRQDEVRERAAGTGNAAGETGAGAAGNGNTKSGSGQRVDPLPAIALRELPEDYYDVRIDSNGDITWHGTRDHFHYDPSADYTALFAEGLEKLVRQEAERHVLFEDRVKKYFEIRHKPFQKTFFFLDDLVESDNFFVLRGWAGVKGIDSGRQLKILELSDKSGSPMYYVCEDESRADVVDAVREPFENAGFRILVDKRGMSGQKLRARMFFYGKEENRITHIASKRLYVQLK